MASFQSIYNNRIVKICATRVAYVDGRTVGRQARAAGVERRPSAGRIRGLWQRQGRPKSRCHARGVAYEDERTGGRVQAIPPQIGVTACDYKLISPPASRCRRAYIVQLFFLSFFFLSSFFRRLISEVTERISTKLGDTCTFTYDCYLKNLVL